MLPVLYLRVSSTRDYREALAACSGTIGTGCLGHEHRAADQRGETEYRAFRRRSLADPDYVHVWVDGVHFDVQLEDDRLRRLVMIGVRPDVTKELIAVEDVWPKTLEQPDWFLELGTISTNSRSASSRACRPQELAHLAAVRGLLVFGAGVEAAFPRLDEPVHPPRAPTAWVVLATDVHALRFSLDQLQERLDLSPSGPSLEVPVRRPPSGPGHYVLSRLEGAPPQALAGLCGRPLAAIRASGSRQPA